MISPGPLTPHPRLILSLFPGAGIMDRGFEAAGWIVLRGPDTLLGQDVRTFTLPAGVVTGVIAGPPCQDFSRARRKPPTGYGAEMLREFSRCVLTAAPAWWLLENVPGVPDLHISGYQVQRFNVFASDFGASQRRNRAIQFGYRDGPPLVLPRPTESHTRPLFAAALASDTHRTLANLKRLQGLPTTFDLPGLSRAAKIRAIGNALPVPVAEAIARAIRDREHYAHRRTCECGCGRELSPSPRRHTATPACRKRMQRHREKHAEHHNSHFSPVLQCPTTDEPNAPNMKPF